MKTYKYISKEMLIKNNYRVEIKPDGSPVVVGKRGEKKCSGIKGLSKYSTNVDPYLFVGLTIDNRKYQLYALSRIVWAWYNGECPSDITIDHIDNKHGTPYDNRIDNLQMLTLEDNLKKKKVSRNQYTWYLTDDEILDKRKERRYNYKYMTKEQLSEYKANKQKVKLTIKLLEDKKKELVYNRKGVENEIDKINAQIIELKKSIRRERTK